MIRTRKPDPERAREAREWHERVAGTGGNKEEKASADDRRLTSLHELLQNLCRRGTLDSTLNKSDSPGSATHRVPGLLPGC